MGVAFGYYCYDDSVGGEVTGEVWILYFISRFRFVSVYVYFRFFVRCRLNVISIGFIGVRRFTVLFRLRCWILSSWLRFAFGRFFCIRSGFGSDGG